jgi:hypothetical protein
LRRTIDLSWGLPNKSLFEILYVSIYTIRLGVAAAAALVKAVPGLSFIAGADDA